LAALAENRAIDGMLSKAFTEHGLRRAAMWARLKFLLLAAAGGGVGLVLASSAVVSHEHGDPGWIGLALSGAALLLGATLLLAGQARRELLAGGKSLLAVGVAVVAMLAFVRADLLCCKMDSLRVVDVVLKSVGASQEVSAKR
jgi:hypothetical protein